MTNLMRLDVMDQENKGNELDEQIQKINALHYELSSLQNQSRQKTIEIGGLLSTAWNDLQYSGIDDWTKNKLSFSERTARQYMALFTKKDKELWQGFKF
jgi:hypothetical protein